MQQILRISAVQFSTRPFCLFCARILLHRFLSTSPVSSVSTAGGRGRTLPPAPLTPPISKQKRRKAAAAAAAAAANSSGVETRKESSLSLSSPLLPADSISAHSNLPASSIATVTEKNGKKSHQEAYPVLGKKRRRKHKKKRDKVVESSTNADTKKDGLEPSKPSETSLIKRHKKPKSKGKVTASSIVTAAEGNLEEYTLGTSPSPLPEGKKRRKHKKQRDKVVNSFSSVDTKKDAWEPSESLKTSHIKRHKKAKSKRKATAPSIVTAAEGNKRRKDGKKRDIAGVSLPNAENAEASQGLLKPSKVSQLPRTKRYKKAGSRQAAKQSSEGTISKKDYTRTSHTPSTRAKSYAPIKETTSSSSYRKPSMKSLKPLNSLNNVLFHNPAYPPYLPPPPPEIPYYPSSELISDTTTPNTTASIKHNAEPIKVGDLPSLKDRQRVDTITDMRRAPGTSFSATSFVPRVDLPVAEILKNTRKAQARAQREWRELGIELSFDEEDWEDCSKDSGNGKKNKGSDYFDPSSLHEKSTRHLRLSNIGLSPLPSDIARLIPDKYHIPQWRNEEAQFVAFPGRDPETMTKLPYYHVLFPVDGPSEYFRRHFRGAVREGDRYPAAVVAAEQTMDGIKSSSEAMTSQHIPNPNPFPHRHRLIRPHQTLPLPGPPWPNSAYLPHTNLIHGNLNYLHLLSYSKPPTVPGHAVLLSTSSQGGSTPETGKLPRTREILERLLAEEYDLIGAYPTFPQPSPPQPLPKPDFNTEGGELNYPELNVYFSRPADNIPGASGILPNGGIIGHSLFPGFNPFLPPRPHPRDTEHPAAGANEELYGVTRILLPSNSRDDPFLFSKTLASNIASSSSSPSSSRNTSTSSPSPSTTFTFLSAADKKRYNSYKEEKRRRASEKRGVEGAEGRWLVRLANREEAWRLVRSWHMREFWTGRGGSRAVRVVVRAEMF